MLRKLMIVGVATLGLAACGGEPHKVCINEEAAVTYSIKWSDDLEAAMASGKIERAKGQEMQAEVNKLSFNRTADTISDFCNRLDELRANGGF